MKVDLITEYFITDMPSILTEKTVSLGQLTSIINTLTPHHKNANTINKSLPCLQSTMTRSNHLYIENRGCLYLCDTFSLENQQILTKLGTDIVQSKR